MFARKSKMVSFRLSAEEYDLLHATCSAQGARSVSELARHAMHRVVAPDSGAERLDLEVRELRLMVEFLSTEVERLGNLVRNTSVHGAS